MNRQSLSARSCASIPTVRTPAIPPVVIRWDPMRSNAVVLLSGDKQISSTKIGKKPRLTPIEVDPRKERKVESDRKICGYVSTRLP